jgi:hypothetical protein
MTPRQATLLLMAGLVGTSPIIAQDDAAIEASPPADDALPSADDALPHIGNRVDYEIEARYNDETHRLDGNETIRWTNASGVPTSELWFHLYWNAFSNNRSTFAMERRPAHKDGEWGWSRVKTVKVNGEDVLASFEYAQPDTGGTTG